MKLPFWIINAIIFQLAWLCAALLTEQASALIFGLLILHFLLTPSPKQDVKLLLLAPMGWALDALLIHYQVFYPIALQLPIWLALLWCVFILSLGHSLTWLGRISIPWLSLIGALCGSLSYYSAIRLGVFETKQALPNLLVILSVCWAIYLPVFICLTNRLNVIPITKIKR